MFNVVIVEDEAMVAKLNRRFVEADSRFRVAAEFNNGKAALEWFRSHSADLLILDVYMPAFTGTELLRELRARGSAIDVIMVTAAHDTHTLDDLLKLGVDDYLVKPFTAQRFQQALNTFCRNRSALDNQDQVSQKDIDRLIHMPLAAEGLAENGLDLAEGHLPKGLQKKTAQLVWDCLRQPQAGSGLSCEELSLATGLSAVTIRRYLNYFMELGEVASRMNYDTGGRPSLAYQLNPAKPQE
ncbi:MAG: response regulator [Clostridiales bacterium]